MRTCCDSCASYDLTSFNFGGSVVSTPSNWVTSMADSIIRTHAIHWILSREVYCHTHDRRTAINGWERDDALNDADVCVYKLGSMAIIAFRGTTTASDILSDISLSTPGNDACAFAKVGPAVEMAKFLLHQGFLVQTTGHSLGGAVARCVGMKLSLGVVTFNMAAPPSNPISTAPNQIHYHIVFDIISAWVPSVRIDKHNRPHKSRSHNIISKIPVVGRLVDSYLFRYSIEPMLKAHDISMFSNHSHGVLVDSLIENRLWTEWFSTLPKVLKYSFLYFIHSKNLPEIP